MGVNVVPAFVDLNTPPEALPTMTCEKSLSSASIAEIRPTRLALPTLRHLSDATSGSPGHSAGGCGWLLPCPWAMRLHDTMTA